MALEYTKSEAKQWAKKNFLGLEAPIFPSYSPDLSELDEDGIRWDVNSIIANGMMSIMIAPEAAAMTREERKRFVAIVNDEAKGRIITSVGALLDTVEENIEIMKVHEETGGTMAMLGHPLMYVPESPEELYRNYPLLQACSISPWRRQWQPTPVFLPGESQGRQSLWAAVYGVVQSQTRLK